MYSPTLRLLTVLELLQTYSSINGKELAHRLEVDIRTVRRYVMSLQDMGIPVAAERGPLGAYRLERGSRLPPLIYNDSEASALVVGLIAMRQLNFPIDAAAVESALAKTIRVLPQRLLCHVNELDDLIKVHNPSYLSATQVLKSDFVWLLEHAIKKRKTTQLTYSAKAGEQSVREVDLYGMVFVAGQWYVSGYCHLREGIRTFRLDRLAAIAKTEKEFIRPSDFDVLRCVMESRSHLQMSFDVEIVLQISIERARSLLPTEVQSLESIDEGVLYSQTTSRLDWLAFTLLNLDVPFKVRSPLELYVVFQEFAEKAKKIAQGKP
ncbi:helix-turn-helix transcriptional regulator [Reinekea sp.]|uniref:helix-turn-helix transcriptional regulator n=1 Tax=Reinekea sp. TaxID=1970455 RepID=UPI0039896F93